MFSRLSQIVQNFPLAHRKWQVAPEERCSIRKRPRSSLGPKRRVVKESAGRLCVTRRKRPFYSNKNKKEKKKIDSYKASSLGLAEAEDV